MNAERLEQKAGNPALCHRISSLVVLLFIMIVGMQANAKETWKLIETDLPILPEHIYLHENRGYQTFVKLERIQEREVAYIHVHQQYDLQWISVFEWDIPDPDTVQTGDIINIKTSARMDRKIGEGGKVGRISVWAEQGYSIHVTSYADGLADPNGILGGPKSEARFEVGERSDYPERDEIRLSIYISDGGSTSERVATYTYKRISSAALEEL